MEGTLRMRFLSEAEDRVHPPVAQIGGCKPGIRLTVKLPTCHPEKNKKMDGEPCLAKVYLG
jgi:hypothetical protein